MPEENYIYSYYQQICNGSVTVGKWVQKVYEQMCRRAELSNVEIIRYIKKEL